MARSVVTIPRKSSPTVRRTEDPSAPSKKPTVSVAPARKPAPKPEPAPARKPTAESERAARLLVQNDPRTAQLRTTLDKKLSSTQPTGGGAGAVTNTSQLTSTPTTTPVSTPRPYVVPDVAEFHPKTDESERSTAVQQRQEQAVKEALTTGQPTTFETSEGKKVQVELHKTDKGYTYSVDGKPTDVTFDPSYDEAAQQRCLAKVIDYHAQSPKVADGVVSRVDFLKADPNSNLAAQYRGGDKSMAFVGEGNLNEANFDHELGHGVGLKLSGGKGMVPSGWEDAVKADGNEVSGYGKESREAMEKDGGWSGWLNEKWYGKDRVGYKADDFAESYQAYKEAKESGPEALEKFRTKFPARAEFLDKHAEELRDSPMPEDPSLPKVA